MLLVAATLALSACGAQQPDAAAIVNGTVISDQDVQSVSDQLNSIAASGQKLTPGNALITLILAPFVLDEAKRAGKAVSTSEARQVIAKVADPSPATIEFVRVQMVIRTLNQTSTSTVVSELGKAKITVNPRYGTFNPQKIVLTPIAPNWIVPTT